MLQKFHVGELTSHEHPVFPSEDALYRQLSREVGQHLASKGLDPKSPWPALLRAVPVYAALCASYYAAFARSEAPCRVLFAALFGVCQALPLLHWMHDACHAALGHAQSLWKCVGRFALDWVSGSSFLAWKNQHVIGHHLFTNALGSDPDLPCALEGDLRRLCSAQRWRGLYRYQHLYLPPLYGIYALKSRVSDVAEIFVRETNGPIRVNPIAMPDRLKQLASKAFWVFYRVVVPLYFFDVPTGEFLLSFLVAELAVGYWLALNFQVSHINDQTSYYFTATQGAKLEDTWSKAQILTSLDYAHGSRLATFLSGALNYQIVHHLFPTVSQYHYPSIAPIVRRVCAEHKIRYNYCESFTDAFLSHLRHLKKMGNTPPKDE